MAIKLPSDTQKTAIDSIQRYFEINMEERIGNLQAAALLDFLLKEIGPSIYNQAVHDAQNQLQQRVQELDIDVHEEEFSYWKNNTPRR